MNNYPVFMIKAKDALAVPSLEAYKDECERHGLREQANQVELAISEFRQWQEKNNKHTKLPNHKHQSFRGSMVWDGEE